MHLIRNGDGVGCDVFGEPLPGKVLTQLAEFSEWNSFKLKAILAHREEGGRHWIAYLNKDGRWWQKDSAKKRSWPCDPFQNQLNPSQGSNGFTLDVLMFSK